jgi:hypothetical protein
MDSPKLIEYGTMQYMQSILSQCHKNRVDIYLYALNIGVFLFFGVILFLILYYSYKTRMTPEELYQKRMREQEYILSKIKVYKEHQHHIARNAGITTLPIVDSALQR